MPTVLCIEDEDQIRAEIVEELEDCGYHAIEAENGLEGLEAIIKHRPDLILCDISMPVMNGFELLDTLREKHSEFACIPFVFLSAFAEPSDVVKGKMKGGDDYITKPVDFVDLLATLEARLSQVARIVKSKETEKDEMRSAILRNIPHELRTPLNHVIGFSEILKNQLLGPLNNDKYLEYANSIYDSGCELLDRVNDAIGIVDTVSGLMVPKMAACDLSILTKECVGITLDKPHSHDNIRIFTGADGHMPTMRTDHNLLQKAILALLSNAIKFSSDGDRIAITTSFDRNRGFCISVSDQGVGITSQDVTRILKAFEQADNSITRKFQGAGLGLTLAKEITEALGGNISLDSELGTGTTVKLDFPAELGGIPNYTDALNYADADNRPHITPGSGI